MEKGREVGGVESELNGACVVGERECVCGGGGGGLIRWEGGGIEKECELGFGEKEKKREVVRVLGRRRGGEFVGMFRVNERRMRWRGRKSKKVKRGRIERALPSIMEKARNSGNGGYFCVMLGVVGGKRRKGDGGAARSRPPPRKKKKSRRQWPLI